MLSSKYSFIAAALAVLAAAVPQPGLDIRNACTTETILSAFTSAANYGYQPHPSIFCSTFITTPTVTKEAPTCTSTIQSTTTSTVDGPAPTVTTVESTTVTLTAATETCATPLSTITETSTSICTENGKTITSVVTETSVITLTSQITDLVTSIVPQAPVTVTATVSAEETAYITSVLSTTINGAPSTVFATITSTSTSVTESATTVLSTITTCPNGKEKWKKTLVPRVAYPTYVSNTCDEGCVSQACTAYVTASPYTVYTTPQVKTTVVQTVTETGPAKDPFTICKTVTVTAYATATVTPSVTAYTTLSIVETLTTTIDVVKTQTVCTTSSAVVYEHHSTCITVPGLIETLTQTATIPCTTTNTVLSTATVNNAETCTSTTTVAAVVVSTSVVTVSSVVTNIACPTAPATCDCPSPIVNPGFENSKSSVAPWAFKLGSGTSGAVSKSSHSGQLSLLFRGSRQAASFNMWQNVKVCPGADYKFSAWVAFNGPQDRNPTCSFDICAGSSCKTTTYGANQAGSWLNIEFPVAVPAGFSNIPVTIQTNADSNCACKFDSIYVDDITLSL